MLLSSQIAFAVNSNYHLEVLVMPSIPGSCGYCKFYSAALDVCYLPSDQICRGEVNLVSPVECPKCLFFDSCTSRCSRSGPCPFIKSSRFSAVRYSSPDFRKPRRETVSFGGVNYG